MTRNYTDLCKLGTFEERFRYLLCNNVVGTETFGHNRYLNQRFYTSSEWRRARREVILRDNGCDLGIADRPISGRIIVHHIVPITENDILNRSTMLLDPENLISVSHDTHECLTYGSDLCLSKTFVERHPNDTCPWR